MQVPIKHERIELLERPPDGQGLAQDIDTVRALINHALNPTHVSFDNFQTFNKIDSFFGHSIHL